MSCTDSQRAFLETLGIELPGELLQQALTHPSSISDSALRNEQSNQRLEFLGDAVIGAAIAESLFQSFPTQPEGVLTQYKIAVVRGESLARAARRLGFGAQLILGRGEENSGGRDREGILADAFEALTGAVLLANGFPAAANFVVRALEPELAKVGENTVNAKNLLQELTQASGLGTPVYETSASSDGGFNAQVLLLGVSRGVGRGRTKRAAESAAAQSVLDAFHASQSST